MPLVCAHIHLQFCPKTRCNPVRGIMCHELLPSNPLYILYLARFLCRKLRSCDDILLCLLMKIHRSVFPAMLTYHHPSSPVGPSTCVKAGAGSSSLNTSTLWATGKSTCSGSNQLKATYIWFKYCWRPGLHRICAS